MSDKRHDDVLDHLKSKEDEMEARIQDARTRAAAIREEALKKVRDIKAARQRELDSEVDGIVAGRTTEIDADVAAVERQAERDAEELRARGTKRIDEAVTEAVRFITEGGCDKGDEKDSDNRPKG